MTLILTIANRKGVHQSSDYQLTDLNTGRPVSDRAGTKQLEAYFSDLHLQLAFTGIAAVGTRRTADWLLGELSALPQKSTLQGICDALRRRATAAMKPLGPRGLLTLVLTVASPGKPFRMAEISNAHWSETPPRARDDFQISINEIVKPRVLISGYRECVPDVEQQRLWALARAIDHPPEKIREELSSINATAARNSHGYVSEECWVSSQVADGKLRRFVAQDVGGRSGTAPTPGAEFTWAQTQECVTATLQGRIRWRVRMYGTLG